MCLLAALQTTQEQVYFPLLTILAHFLTEDNKTLYVTNAQEKAAILVQEFYR